MKEPAADALSTPDGVLAERFTQGLRAPLVQLLLLALALGLAGQVLQVRAATQPAQDTPADRLGVDEYAVGIVRQLRDAGSGLRLDAAQARRLLQEMEVLERGLLRVGGGEAASLELFRAVLSSRQERYIRYATWRRKPFLVEPLEVIAQLRDCLRTRAQEGQP